MNIVKNIDQLLELNDFEFIEGAYQALLGRAADPEGMRYYLARLRAGYDKTGIIAQIAMSSEMQPTEKKSPVLQEMIDSTKNTRHWLKGIFSRNNRVERQAHRIENELGRKLDKLTAQQALTSAHFERIQTSLVRQKSDLDSLLSNAKHLQTEQQGKTASRLDSIHYGLVAQKSDTAVHLDRMRQSFIELQSNTAIYHHSIEKGFTELKSGTETQLNRVEFELTAIRESFQILTANLKPKTDTAAHPLAQLAASDNPGLSQRAKRMLASMAQAATRITYRGAA